MDLNRNEFSVITQRVVTPFNVFNVIEFGTKGKPVCDFLLVNVQYTLYVYVYVLIILTYIPHLVPFQSYRAVGY